MSGVWCLVSGVCDLVGLGGPGVEGGQGPVDRHHDVVDELDLQNIVSNTPETNIRKTSVRNPIEAV